MLLGRAVQRRGAAFSRSLSFGMAQLRPGSSSLRRSSFSLRYVYGLSTDRSSRDGPSTRSLQPLHLCQKCYWAAMPFQLCAPPPQTVGGRGRAACGYATESTPRLPRAERRRRERAEKKGKPLPPLPAKPSADDETNKYTGGKLELKGVTDLGIFKAIKHNVSCVCLRARCLVGWPTCSRATSPSPNTCALAGVCFFRHNLATRYYRRQHGGLFLGYWGGTWVSMYVVLWACMQNAGVDAVQWIQTAGLDETLRSYVGVDVGGWSPTLINALVAIEINYLLEFARLPVVLFLLKKRNARGGADAAVAAQPLEPQPGDVLDKRHSADIADKFKP
eukprot:COSAG03_NODE_4535_length_1519_cov_13.961681_2_plen_333_part_00